MSATTTTSGCTVCGYSGTTYTHSSPNGERHELCGLCQDASYWQRRPSCCRR